ncbi:MAG: hypothetical protein C4343_07005 [Chloroflexota bacterium]
MTDRRTIAALRFAALAGAVDGATAPERLAAEVDATPEAYRAYIPLELRDWPLRGRPVVETLEGWASRRAAKVLGQVFLVAGAVTALAVPPAAGLSIARRRTGVGEAAREDGNAERAGPGELAP